MTPFNPEHLRNVGRNSRFERFLNQAADEFERLRLRLESVSTAARSVADDLTFFDYGTPDKNRCLSLANILREAAGPAPPQPSTGGYDEGDDDVERPAQDN